MSEAQSGGGAPSASPAPTNAPATTAAQSHPAATGSTQAGQNPGVPEPQTTSESNDTSRDEQRALVREKLERLRAQKAYRESREAARKQQEAASNDYSKQFEELKSYRSQLEAEHEKIKSFWKDPVTGFKQYGIAPEQLYQRMNDYFADNNTPEAKQRRMMESLQDEIKKQYEPTLQELKKQLEEEKNWRAQEIKRQEEAKAREMQAEAARQEQMFMSEMQKPEYEELFDEYDDSAILQAGYAVAQQLHDSGRPADHATVARVLLDLHRNHDINRQKKREAKQARASLSNPESATPRTSEPRAIGNAMAAESATQDRAPTREDRARNRRTAIGQMLAPYRDKK